MERGLLTGKYSGQASGLSQTDHRNSYFQKFDEAKLKALLHMLEDMAVSYRCSITQLVLAWTIAQKGITTVLGGARNRAQAEHNAKALQVSPGKDDQESIRLFLQQL